MIDSHDFAMYFAICYVCFDFSKIHSHDFDMYFATVLCVSMFRCTHSHDFVMCFDCFVVCFDILLHTPTMFITKR